MKAPNIEELIVSLRLHQANSRRHDIYEQAANAMQSQAERIAELERESETHAKAYGLAIVERDNLRHELKTAQEGWRCECSTDDACRFARERDALRAQLAAIAATEPVLIVEKEPDYWSGGHFHEGSKSHIKPTKVWCLPVGTQLFTRPMPAQDVTELVEALEKLYKKYVNLLESGRDRILELGGTCDPVDVMEMSDPGLRDARNALSKYKGAK